MSMPEPNPSAARRRRCIAALALILAGCAQTPYPGPPALALPAAYREAAAADGWVPAAPADRADRGRWWSLFADAELDRLMDAAAASNPSVQAAQAAVERARALLAGERAGRAPVIGADAGATRSGGDARGGAANSFSAGLAASWEPDFWGRIAGAVAGAEASLAGSEADLASARLAVQAELAADYFALREADAEIDLLDRTVAGYERSLQIAQNRYDAGVAPRTDVLQARSQLASARADRVALAATRQQLEHALAVLTGRPPGAFALPKAAWALTVPEVPPGVPSELLQRRPDIASAERAVAAAHAQIGIARTGYYPRLTLSGSAGVANARIAELASAPSVVWSIGAALAQTLFDGGATRAAVQAAEASRDAAVAGYRQTVLTALKEVDDQLASIRSLVEQQALRREASEAADLAEQQVQNRYRAGQVSYAEVVAAQATALSARRALVQLEVARQQAAIGLIRALGGGWGFTT